MGTMVPTCFCATTPPQLLLDILSPELRKEVKAWNFLEKERDSLSPFSVLFSKLQWTSLGALVSKSIGIFSWELTQLAWKVQEPHAREY